MFYDFKYKKNSMYNVQNKKNTVLQKYGSMQWELNMETLR